MKLDALNLATLSTDAERDRRLLICETCPSLKKGPINLCRECGCPIRSIIRLKSKSCPRGLWES